MLKNTSVYLIGMMGSGKSTVGKHLAERLNYRFFDTDVLITQVTQCSIPALFSQGEAEFRQIEQQVLAQLAPYGRLVVATGGGIVTQRANWSYLRTGLIVWLEVPVSVLVTRLEQETEQRPLVHSGDLKATLTQILQERHNLYAQADVIVSGAASPTQVCDHVLTGITQRIEEDQEYVRERISG